MILLNFTTTFLKKDKELENIGVKYINHSWFKPLWNNQVLKNWPVFREKWISILGEDKIRTGEIIVKNFQWIQDELSRQPCTLLHGDIKLGNILFTKEEVPVFIDWQYVTIGKGGIRKSAYRYKWSWVVDEK